MINNIHGSLAVKYRPTTLDEVCGQNITVTILKQIIYKKAFKNCYIFSGVSGTGKTTIARIFANAINNGVGTPIEIDAASNNGVDNIRSIMEAANERSLTGEYKVYIIDEAHSLTAQAWQAFLKGIEECPKYTIFIFCTTEPQKLPETILNRMQKFTFAPISNDEIKNRLIYICKMEGFTNYESGCELISKISAGGMRTAITFLEQCSDFSNEISADNVNKVLHCLPYELFFKLTWAFTENNESEFFNIIEQVYSMGIDLKYFIDQYLEFILNLIKYILFKKIELTNIPSYLAAENNQVVQFTVRDPACSDKFNFILDSLIDLKAMIKNDTDIKTTITASLLSICRRLNKSDGN